MCRMYVAHKSSQIEDMNCLTVDIHAGLSLRRSHGLANVLYVAGTDIFLGLQRRLFGRPGWATEREKEIKKGRIFEPL